MSGELAHLMIVRCPCGQAFTPPRDGIKYCSLPCRFTARQQQSRDSMRRHRAQLSFRLRPVAPSKRPTHCGCGGRFTLGADLWPSSRCPACQPLTTREKVNETRRVNQRTRQRAMSSVRAKVAA